MQLPPELPNGVTWDDVELIPDDTQGKDDFIEREIVYVARNKKTGEIYR